VQMGNLPIMRLIGRFAAQYLPARPCAAKRKGVLAAGAVGPLAPPVRPWVRGKFSVELAWVIRDVVDRLLRNVSVWKRTPR
jgi:hypothetical protein